MKKLDSMKGHMSDIKTLKADIHQTSTKYQNINDRMDREFNGVSRQMYSGIKELMFESKNA